jgi:hypothetical protein
MMNVPPGGVFLTTKLTKDTKSTKEFLNPLLSFVRFVIFVFFQLNPRHSRRGRQGAGAGIGTRANPNALARLFRLSMTRFLYFAS